MGSTELGWIGLYSVALVEWLENENRVNDLCSLATVGTSSWRECREETLKPRQHVLHLRNAPTASGTSAGSIVVQAIPGRGLRAFYRAAAGEPATEFLPDLFDADWGYGPYFHQYVTSSQDVRGAFLTVSAIIFLVLSVVVFVGGGGFLVQALFGPATRPWKLTFWEGVVFIPVLLAALCVGLVVWVPLWTLFARPFAPRREIGASLTYPGIFFFSWYCRTIADRLVPESRDEGGTGR